MSEGSVALAPEKLGRPLPGDGGRNARPPLVCANCRLCSRAAAEELRRRPAARLAAAHRAAAAGVLLNVDVRAAAPSRPARPSPPPHARAPRADGQRAAAAAAAAAARARATMVRRAAKGSAAAAAPPDASNPSHPPPACQWPDVDVDVLEDGRYVVEVSPAYKVRAPGCPPARSRGAGHAGACGTSSAPVRWSAGVCGAAV